MKPVSFSKEETAAIVGELQTWFREELEVELGDLPGEMLLDFLKDAIGPYFYNRALYDAQAIIAARAEDMGEAVLLLERKAP